jgi:hypothetical protein
MAWNTVRAPYQDHIKHMIQYVDFLSEQYARTGEQFYHEEYCQMTQAVSRVKQWIVEHENRENTTV